MYINVDCEYCSDIKLVKMNMNVYRWNIKIYEGEGDWKQPLPCTVYMANESMPIVGDDAASNNTLRMFGVTIIFFRFFLLSFFL